MVPGAGNPQALNRYAYTLGNPLRYTDPSGHCVDGITTWACVAVVVGVASKVIDYGLTLYDGYQASRVLGDPYASHNDKLLAGLNVGLTMAFEALEPDDLLPVGLPADDVARRAVIKGAREAFEEGGVEAVERFIRDTLGDQADDVLEQMWKASREKGAERVLRDGMQMSTDDALDAAVDFLGEGYIDMGNGRFMSADGLRQTRMTDADILGTHGGGPHMNFETLTPRPGRPGRFNTVKNLHIYLVDP